MKSRFLIAMVPMRAPQALKRLDTESTMITRSSTSFMCPRLVNFSPS